MQDTRLSRRTFANVAALATASLGAPALLAQPQLEKSKIAIAVGGKAAFYYLPLTIAEQLGYFKAEGLEVEISDFAGGSRALQAVVGGSADVVSGAYEHTINLQSNELMLLGIVTNCEPSLGVFARSVIANVKPLSVDNNRLTNEVLILLAFVPATFQVMVCDEFPAQVIPTLFCDVTTNGPALAFTVSIISSRLTFEP